MTTYEITYRKTGSGERDLIDKVWISSGDELRCGAKVHNIIEAIIKFEELAEEWGYYETKHAIKDITVTER